MANKYIKKPTRSTMNGRWATFGPYYAMFPVEFALNAIYKYTNEISSNLNPRYKLKFEKARIGFMNEIEQISSDMSNKSLEKNK